MQTVALARRRDRIVNLLSMHGDLSATSLSDMLGVSVQTIRADLRNLDEQQIIRRRHGSASLCEVSENIGYQPRLALARDEKSCIGAAVAGLIPDGAKLAIGTGTTAEEVARALVTRENLFVATNNIHAVLALRAAPNIAITVAGGNLRVRDLDFIGAESQEFFEGYRLDFAVFSCGGLSLDGNLLDYNMDEIRARRAVSGAASHRILVMDSTKIGRNVPLQDAFIWDFETIVYAGVIPQEVERACIENGCTLITV